jgi:hypothetical protein
MKKKTRFTIVISLILLVSGCIPSLHPLYFDKDRLELKLIEGNWISDSDDIWEFVKVENEPSYILKYTEEQPKGEKNPKSQFANFEANIIKLGEYYFMDLFPEENDYINKMNDFLAGHLLQAHTFLKLEVKGDQILIYQMSPEWLETLFDENKIRISHERLDEDNIVLTASTKELQKFITKYAEDEKAFMDPEILSPIH